MSRILIAVSWLVATMCAFSPVAGGQLKRVDAEGHDWWHYAVFYEVYPRSFADSNNDGVGDLNGITSKLDYLQHLGVNAIWITPCFPSPQVDFGYDVSDYENIDPMYGTLADFDRLVAEAKKHNIKIILDFVPSRPITGHRRLVALRGNTIRRPVSITIIIFTLSSPTSIGATPKW
jgi:alpha-glucosidase